MLTDKLWNHLMLQRKKVHMGIGSRINGRVFIHGSKGAITIGNNCTIQSDERINPTSGFSHTHLTAGSGASLVIGNNVGISHANITANNNVVIEDNVLIGSGVKIWDTDFHSIDYEGRMNHPDSTIKTAPIRICEGAFIGGCTIVLKGVTIGRHSVVGAGSVVTKDIPDNEVWAGNPAKPIKKLGKMGGGYRPH